ncbi:MAG TPA: recombinase family protein [Nitrospinae bacterium]|nr:recombinase family protein [Nitrospinota bacterium]
MLRIRCAIYTRKSSEEGLEQEFNSLDAQRESCEAYIKSQRAEGWVPLPERYDDGGFSGGTIERPALKHLLDDVKAGRVDVVVVYKVDRLTRALSDFVRMVETFDAHSVSFVSVTQQFNTTSSMGRLTLNVLLSFAQFEREVTGERIRDKIAASKKKGMWMGGLPPLGYDVKDRKLVVNEGEAKTVRRIFQKYVEAGSVRLLKNALDSEGIVSKVRKTRTGLVQGGKPIAQGALYLMLQNRIYLGEIVHKDKSYPGEHDAIVDRPLWDRAQAKLTSNRVDRQNGTNAQNPSLLAGLLYGERGERLTPTHAVKKGRRYRYYVSQNREDSPSGDSPSIRRIPAGDIEHIVTRRMQEFLSDPAELLGTLEAHAPEAIDQKNFLGAAASLARGWTDFERSRIRGMLLATIFRIEVLKTSVNIHIAPSRLAKVLRSGRVELPPAHQSPREETESVLSVPAQLKRTGMEMKILISGDSGKNKPDSSLVRLIVKAHTVRESLPACSGMELSELAKHHGVGDSYISRLFRLTFLAPDITKAILEGRHPPELTGVRLMRDTRFPLDWDEQRRVLGFI